MDEEEEQLHDGGLRLYPDGWVQPDCECGWVGLTTRSIELAMAERIMHEKMPNG